MARTFTDLQVWIRSRKIMNDVYDLCEGAGMHQSNFPLQNQITKAAVSIMSNIAKGAGRKTSGDFSRFIDIAIGSTFEVKSQLFVIQDRKLASGEQCEHLRRDCDEIGKMLYGLQRSLYKTT